MKTTVNLYFIGTAILRDLQKQQGEFNFIKIQLGAFAGTLDLFDRTQIKALINTNKDEQKLEILPAQYEGPYFINLHKTLTLQQDKEQIAVQLHVHFDITSTKFVGDKCEYDGSISSYHAAIEFDLAKPKQKKLYDKLLENVNTIKEKRPADIYIEERTQTSFFSQVAQSIKGFFVKMSPLSDDIFIPTEGPKPLHLLDTFSTIAKPVEKPLGQVATKKPGLFARLAQGIKNFAQEVVVLIKQIFNETLALFEDTVDTVIDSQIPEEYKVNNPATKESSYSHIFSNLPKAEPTLGSTPTAAETLYPNLDAQAPGPQASKEVSVQYMPGLFSTSPNQGSTANVSQTSPKP